MVRPAEVKSVFCLFSYDNITTRVRNASLHLNGAPGQFSENNFSQLGGIYMQTIKRILYTFCRMCYDPILAYTNPFVVFHFRVFGNTLFVIPYTKRSIDGAERELVDISADSCCRIILLYISCR